MEAFSSLWPRNAKAAVCLTGDVDAAGDLAEGRLERLLATLDDFEVKFTFPITAHAFIEDPDVFKPIIERGDEIAGHGDIHVGFNGQKYSTQKTRLILMMETIEKICGVRIRGFRAPYLSKDANTIKAETELGILYDSSVTYRSARLWHSEEDLHQKTRSKRLRSLTHSTQLKLASKFETILRYSRPVEKLFGLGSFSGRLKDQPFNPIVEEEKLGIVVLPLSHDDYYLIDVWPRLKYWEDVAAVWKKEFDCHYNGNGLYVLLAHPLRIGRQEYIGALRSLIEYAKSKNDVWFTTLAELAGWWNTSRRK